MKDKEKKERQEKMEKKIIFFDIDGTLIDMNTHKVSERVLETLRQLKKNGFLLGISTGRSPVLLPKIEGITFDFFITFNGSYCYNEKEEIFSNAILREDVKVFLENAAKMNRPLSVATKTRVAANGWDDDLATYYSFGNTKLVVADDFDVVKEDEIYQFMLACKPEEYDQLLQGTVNCKVATWWDRAADIIPKDGGKGQGIAHVLEYYGLTKEQAIAFGDGNNDIEMMGAVGTSIAMGNASDELKSISTEVCEDVSEDGIYHACKRHGWI